MERILPNLIIGGAQKSATTSLHSILASHPDVFFPPSEPYGQEIHFFDLEENYRRGVDWYAGLFRDWAGQKVIGQTSPLYLYDAKTPAAMAALLPQVRLVFILREPVARAYSHYWHEVRYGWELESFERALELEPERIARGPVARRHFSYLDRGRYAGQLERYREHFPREQMLVLLHEHLHRQPDALLTRVAHFLGIDAERFNRDVARRVHNRTRVPRVRWLQRLVRDLRDPFPRLCTLVDRLNLSDAGYPPMRLETRERLRANFAPELARLEEIWGLELSPWRTP